MKHCLADYLQSQVFLDVIYLARSQGLPSSLRIELRGSRRTCRRRKPWPQLDKYKQGSTRNAHDDCSVGLELTACLQSSGPEEDTSFKSAHGNHSTKQTCDSKEDPEVDFC